MERNDRMHSAFGYFHSTASVRFTQLLQSSVTHFDLIYCQTGSLYIALTVLELSVNHAVLNFLVIAFAVTVVVLHWLESTQEKNENSVHNSIYVLGTQRLSIFLFFFFIVFIILVTGSYSVALGGLKLSMQIRLARNSQPSSCLLSPKSWDSRSVPPIQFLLFSLLHRIQLNQYNRNCLLCWHI